jgi:hypothetical protein
MQKCVHCGEAIRPNQTGGWYHVETPAHRSDQRCFLYAAPEPHRTSYIDSEGEERCTTCDKWLEPGYYDIEDHLAATVDKSTDCDVE